MKKIISYLKGVWGELKKITFPSFKNTLGLTLLVVVLCVILATYTGLLDLGFTRVVRDIVAK